MNFFQKIRNLVGFRSHQAVLASSTGNLSIFEKLLFFNDQGIFSLLFFGSLLLHVILVIMVSMISEFLKPEPPPIRAKIGVRYAELPVRSNPVINSKKKKFFKNDEISWRTSQNRWMTSKSHYISYFSEKIHFFRLVPWQIFQMTIILVASMINFVGKSLIITEVQSAPQS